MIRRIFSIALMACVCCLAICANGMEEAKLQQPESLEFAIKETGSTLEAYQGIVERFNLANPSIHIEIVTYGKDYESLMKTKMASNDLPDLWTTHGWAVFLYGKYLLPINDLECSALLLDEIKSTETDLQGNIVAFPMDIDISGMICNEKILKTVGVEEPKNLPDFLVTCEKILKAGYTPIHVAGKDASDVAGLVGRLSLSILTTSKTHNFAKNLYDGSFDWKKFDEVGDFILNLAEKGYLNVDYLTADKSGTYKGLAQDKVAFAFQSNQTIAEVKKLNPDSSVKMMGIPGYTTGDYPFLISGERDAVGIWKDSKHKAAAQTFVNFLAIPENVLAIAEAYNLPPSTSNATTSNKDLAVLKEELIGVNVTNHFDREYLPNGMWNTLKVYSSSILSKETIVPEGSVMMEKDYNRLKK